MTCASPKLHPTEKLDKIPDVLTVKSLLVPPLVLAESYENKGGRNFGEAHLSIDVDPYSEIGWHIDACQHFAASQRAPSQQSVTNEYLLFSRSSHRKLFTTSQTMPLFAPGRHFGEAQARLESLPAVLINPLYDIDSK
jgi:hypothetical protein